MKTIVIILVISQILVISVGCSIASEIMSINERFSPPTLGLDGSILYVGGDGPGNYTFIQDAINASSDGDTVFVFDDSAPYFENLLVNKSINLIGENNESTIIDGNRNGDVVRIISDNVYISGFTIRNGGLIFPDSGIFIQSNYNILIGNNLIDNFYGFVIFYSHNNEIIDNQIINNHQCGIYLENASNNTVSGNYINGHPFNGVGLFNSSDNNMISGNTILNNEYSGIRMISTTGNIATMNTISDNTFGVRVEYSPNSMISSNNFIKNRRLQAFSIGNIFFNNNYTFANNYWNRPRFFPKIIFGISGKSNLILPWITFDRHPSRQLIAHS